MSRHTLPKSISATATATAKSIIHTVLTAHTIVLVVYAMRG